jgi:Uma2 family endonuclease
MATTKLYTAEDLLEMEDDGCRHELIRGELITMPPTNDEHSDLMLHLSALLWNYQNSHPEVRSFAGDPGFMLARDPDILLGPDFATIRTDRLPADFPRRTFFDIVPDLVIEIVSPSERVGQISAKVDAYLNAGVRLIWLINPMCRNVTIHSPDQHTHILEGNDALDGGDVLPEFRLPLGELFR